MPDRTSSLDEDHRRWMILDVDPVSSEESWSLKSEAEATAKGEKETEISRGEQR